jgi:hypothetical protein
MENIPFVRGWYGLEGNRFKVLLKLQLSLFRGKGIILPYEKIKYFLLILL